MFEIGDFIRMIEMPSEESHLNGRIGKIVGKDSNSLANYLIQFTDGKTGQRRRFKLPASKIKPYLELSQDIPDAQCNSHNDSEKSPGEVGRKRAWDDSSSGSIESDVRPLKKPWMSGVRFPVIPKDHEILKVNFVDYARVNQPDVSISNRDISVKAHKKILRSLSAFFETLFSGDDSIKVVYLDDIQSKILAILYKIIYENPVKTNQSGQPCGTGFYRTPKCIKAQTCQELTHLLLMIGKYEFKILEELVFSRRRNYAFKNGNLYSHFNRQCAKLNLWDLRSEAQAFHLTYMHAFKAKILQTYPYQDVLAKIENFDFDLELCANEDVKETFFYRCVQFAFSQPRKSEGRKKVKSALYKVKLQGKPGEFRRETTFDEIRKEMRFNEAKRLAFVTVMASSNKSS